MATTIEGDRLGLLKGACLEKIKRCKDELDELHGKLKRIETMEEEARGLIKNDVGSSTKFAGFGISEASIDSLKSLVSQGPLPHKDIGNYMLAHGYDPRKTNFFQCLSTTLKRLSQTPEKTMVHRKLVDGINVYWFA